jgi:membrane associated rhomboid family serine protease
VVIVGTVVALALVWSSTFAAERVIGPGLSGLNVLWVIVLSSLILSHLLGGFVAGRSVSSSLGLSGAITAVLSALVGVARFLPVLLPFAHELFSGPENRSLLQEQAFSENGGLISWHVMTFVLYFPFTVLAGCLGGLLGGHLRSVARHGADRTLWQGLR